MKKTALIFSCLLLVTLSLFSQNDSSDLLLKGEHYIEIDGVKLWYLVRGQGPILIVYPSSAGWGGDCSVYVEYLSPWEEERTVIYLEPRGLGKSERLDSMSEYSMDKYVEELENFRRKLGIEKFDLYGHCYAGMISLKYAVKYGENLSHLIVMSTWPKVSGSWSNWVSQRSGFDTMIKRSEEIEKGNLSAVDKLKEKWKNTYTVTFHDYSKHKDIFENIMENTLFSLLPQQQFNFEHPNYDITDEIIKINTNTLIAYGDKDLPMAINGSKVLSEKIPNSKLVEVKNCCHWAFIEQPEEFFSETINFLNN
ncbi:alpha/beta fold hydrolase [Draconibacterium sediminis]|uniref:alpha/beta fold hydrolase n=1 Tax=Draconibacterium sediminis TaxID=1544798 RepID=UPI0026EBD023|nr:alpha/beta hydrolase [Draconibacterium sediminis]